jgi:hypothetical protein
VVEDLARSTDASLDLNLEYRTGHPGLDVRSSELRARCREIERNTAEVASETRELPDSSPGSCQPATPPSSSLLGGSEGRITQL